MGSWCRAPPPSASCPAFPFFPVAFVFTEKRRPRFMSTEEQRFLLHYSRGHTSQQHSVAGELSGLFGFFGSSIPAPPPPSRQPADPANSAGSLERRLSVPASPTREAAFKCLRPWRSARRSAFSLQPSATLRCAALRCSGMTASVHRAGGSGRPLSPPAQGSPSQKFPWKQN